MIKVTVMDASLSRMPFSPKVKVSIVTLLKISTSLTLAALIAASFEKEGELITTQEAKPTLESDIAPKSKDPPDFEGLGDIAYGPFVFIHSGNI